METKSGTIKMIKTNGLYGFIKQDDGEEDVFFHSNGVISPEFKDLREGMTVEYMVTASPKGGRAIGVVVI
ncbi:MAG TPA: cold shock domain-containing protein [Desulfosporosinus sp.]|nr:cold shock domain-containing protein [Desulfosporosinus sp.]